MKCKEIYKQIRRTHKGLETYYLTTLVSVLGGKGVYLIGEQGSGKSAILLSIAENLRPYYTIYRRDILTLQGLANDLRNSANASVLAIVDDYSASGTYYTKMNLLSTLAQLNYTRTVSISKRDMQISLRFNKFDYILAIQPRWLDSILNSEEYNSLIKDKTVRVYILHRPLKPNLSLIKLELDLIDDVKVSKDVMRSGYFALATDNLKYLYSAGRAIETLLAILKGIGKIEKKQVITKDDKSILSLAFKITKLLKVENLLISGEEVKSFNLLLYRLMNMYYTYRTFTLEQFCKEFKLNYEYSSELLNSREAKKYVYRNSPNFVFLTHFDNISLFP